MISYNYKIKNHITNKSKQKGATLFTALVFLALMTIVSVSAAKISMFDVLVSGNNQQQMELFQETAREIDDHARPANLLKLVINTDAYSNPRVAWDHNYPSIAAKPNLQKSITNRVIEYPCGAINGLATSQGAGNSCRLYDFEVRTRKQNSSARDRHARGGGKEYPTASRNNFNN